MVPWAASFIPPEVNINRNQISADENIQILKTSVQIVKPTAKTSFVATTVSIVTVLGLTGYKLLAAAKWA